MAKLRAAVVGTGLIATKKHIPAFLRQRGKVDLVAIVDLNAEAARVAAEKFGIPKVYAELGEMLERERPDMVDICTPPRTHSAVAIGAMNGSCHVMIEKPMATSVEECDAIIETAERLDRKVCVAHSDLFYPPFLRARSLVAKGTIGECQGMRIFLSTPTDYMTSRQDHWAHKLPGGVIGESGPHVVYMTLAFIHPIREIRVRGSKLLPYPWSRYEDYRIELVGEKATCSVTCIYTSDEWAGQVDLWGSSGILRLDLELMSLVQPKRKSLSRLPLAVSGARESLKSLLDIAGTGATAMAGRYQNTHDILIGSFLESIRTGMEPPVTAAEGREAVRVMNMIAAQLDAQPVAGHPGPAGPALTGRAGRPTAT